MQLETLKLLFKKYKETQLFHRYINGKKIVPLFEKLKKECDISVIGKSVLQENIYSVTIGSGDKKILMWSQMHGNESTTTKAVFDLLNLLVSKNEVSNNILSNCTIKIIPILNPDGANMYTRINANQVDLNRDAQNLTQPESKILKKCFEDFNPHFCYNLHGQRTIFSAGSISNSAVMSFLAPAQDEKCSITDNRKRAMELIAVMNDNLQNQIPNQIGIYDDAFNINCVGDTFQANNTPTVLFEAGHYENDYEREKVREYVFQSLLVSLSYISDNVVSGDAHESYLNIPENEKLFYDIIIRNTRVEDDGELIDIAVQYQEILVGNIIEFIPKIEKFVKTNMFYAHKEFNANGCLVETCEKAVVSVGDEIDFVRIDNEKISLKMLKS